MSRTRSWPLQSDVQFDYKLVAVLKIDTYAVTMKSSYTVYSGSVTDKQGYL